MIVQMSRRDFGRALDRVKKTSTDLTEKYFKNMNYEYGNFKGLRFRNNEGENEDSLADREDQNNGFDQELDEKVKDLSLKVPQNYSDYIEE